MSEEPTWAGILRRVDAPHVSLIAHTPIPEQTIELAGRTAYKSFDKITPTSSGEFVKRMVRNGHDSVLEHGSATLRFQGISRACSHQFVRHRVASFTQESQRFVDQEGAEFVIPPSIRANLDARSIFYEYMAMVDKTYAKLKELGIPAEDARFILPNATSTEIAVSANFREWRHILKLRGAPDAQWEIRQAIIDAYEILRDIAPAVFGDFVIASHPDNGLYLAQRKW